MVYTPRNSDDYLRQIYGGTVPTMDYYSQLGAMKRANVEAARQAREEEREKERRAKERARIKEQAEKERAEERKKKQKDEALQKLLEELKPTADSASISSTEKYRKTEEKRSSFLADLFSIGKNMLLSGTGFRNPAQSASEAAKRTAREYVEKDRELSPTTKEVARGAARAADSGVFGAISSLARRRGDEQLEDLFFGEREGIGRVADIGYDILGSLAPGGAIAAGLRGTRFGARVTPEMSRLQRIGQYAKEGSVAGGLFGLGEAVTTEAITPDERTLGQHLGRIGLEAGLGAVLDPAIMEVAGALTRLRPRAASRLADELPQGLPRPEERLGLPEPDNTNLLPEPPRQLPPPDEAYTQAQERITQIEQELSQIEDQIRKFDDTLSQREAEFAETQTQRRAEAEQTLREYERMFEEMEQEFIDSRRLEYESQRANAEAEWQTAKDNRRLYKEIRATKENQFYIPKEYKEEFGNIVPRSFIRNNSKTDIFSAAEAHGFRGDIEGALEFANYLRYLQTSRTIRKKDLIPKEPEELKIDRLRQEFRQSDDAKGLSEVIENLRRSLGEQTDFRTTDEYAQTIEIRRRYEEQIQKLQEERQALSSQIEAYNAPQSELALPRQQAVLPEMPQAQTQQIAENIQAQRDADQIVRQADEQPTDVDLFSVRGRDDRDSFLSTMDDKITKYTDDVHPIYALNKYLKRNQESYEAARLVRGASSSFEQYLNQTLTPAVTSFKGSRDKLKQAWKYVVERHVLDVKNKYPNYRIPGGANKAQLEQTVKRFEKDPEIQKLAKAVRDYQRGILDLLEAEGIISKEVKDALIKEYPNYIPLFRHRGTKPGQDDLDEVFSFYDRLNSENVRKVINELSEYGGEDLIKDPIGNLVQYGLNAYHAAFSNRALRYIKEIDGTKIGNKVIAKKVTKQNKDKIPKENIVSFFENGKRVRYYVHNDLKRAYDNLKGIMQFDEIANIVAKIAKVQRQSITANPIFTTRQLIRDIPQAWVVGDFSLIKDLPIAFIDAVTQGRLLGDKSIYKKFIEHGGGMNALVTYDRNAFLALQRASNKISDDNTTLVTAKNTLNTLKTVFDKLRLFNEGLENAPKLAQFRAVARKTGDLQKAAYEGRDIMDFARAGERVRNINKYVAFVNANIQGKSKQFRALTQPGKRLSTGLKTMAVGAGMSIVAKQAVDAWATDEQKRVINEAPEWLRQTYWLIPHWDNNKILRIPKPYEVAMIASTPVEFILNNEDKVGTDLSDMLKEWFNQVLWIDPSLNPATPIYETISNRDTFTGQAIVPNREKDLPASEQYDVHTASTAKGAANLLNLIPGLEVSPRQVEHLTEGYFPISGENVNDVIDLILEKTGVRDVEKPAGVTSIEHINPLNPLSILEMDISQRTSPLVSNAYDTVGELQGLKRQTQEAGQPFPYHDAYSAVRRIADQDSEITATLRMIDNDPNLTREEKRELREQYIRQRNMNVRNAEELGLFDTSEENLARLNQRYQGLGQGETRSDIETQLTARLVEAGVPEHAVREVLRLAKEQGMSDEQLANALRQLLKNYQ